MTEAVPAAPAGQAEPIPAEKSEPKLNRREFLNIAWLASLGFLTLSISGLTVLFSLPRLREGQFGAVFTPGTIADLPPEGTSPQNFPKVKLWLSNTADGLMALYKICPHLGCLYAWNDQEFKFICPCHGSQYQHNGTYISGPAPRSLDRFIIRIEDENGNVLAETPEDGGPLLIEGQPPTAIVRVDTAERITGAAHA